MKENDSKQPEKRVLTPQEEADLYMWEAENGINVDRNFVEATPEFIAEKEKELKKIESHINELLGNYSRSWNGKGMYNIQVIDSKVALNVIVLITGRPQANSQ